LLFAVVAFLVVVVTAVASKISNVAFGCGLVVWICPIGDVGFGIWITVNCVNDVLADKEKTEESGDDELLKWWWPAPPLALGRCCRYSRR
jgi:hypothetical protein